MNLKLRLGTFLIGPLPSSSHAAEEQLTSNRGALYLFSPKLRKLTQTRTAKCIPIVTGHLCAGARWLLSRAYTDRRGCRNKGHKEAASYIHMVALHFP